jgi:GAF domain-containing protein
VVINPVLQQATAALRRAITLEQVQDVVRTSARQLVDANGTTFVLLDGDKCFYADEDAMSPLWKGQRFPMEQCISGWAMMHQQPAVVPDIRLDDRIVQSVYTPTFVRSLVMVPIDIDNPLGAIGAYWARVRRATNEEVTGLIRLASITAQTLHRISPMQTDDR